MLPALPRSCKCHEVSELESYETFSANARRWYMDPCRVSIAQKHDRLVERRYADFCTTITTDFLNINEELDIWDIGCGEGMLAEHLQEHYPYLRYTGFDPNPGENPLWKKQTSEIQRRFMEARASDVVDILSDGECAPSLIFSSLSFALWDKPERELRALAQLSYGISNIIIIDLLRTGEPKPVHSPALDLRSFLKDQYNVSWTPRNLSKLAAGLGRRYQFRYFRDDGSTLNEFEEPVSGYGSVFALLIDPQ